MRHCRIMAETGEARAGYHGDDDGKRKNNNGGTTSTTQLLCTWCSLFRFRHMWPRNASTLHTGTHARAIVCTQAAEVAGAVIALIVVVSTNIVFFDRKFSMCDTFDEAAASRALCANMLLAAVCWKPFKMWQTWTVYVNDKWRLLVCTKG